MRKVLAMIMAISMIFTLCACGEKTVELETPVETEATVVPTAVHHTHLQSQATNLSEISTHYINVEKFTSYITLFHDKMSGVPFKVQSDLQKYPAELLMTYNIKNKWLVSSSVILKNSQYDIGEVDEVTGYDYVVYTATQDKKTDANSAEQLWLLEVMSIIYALNDTRIDTYTMTSTLNELSEFYNDKEAIVKQGEGYNVKSLEVGDYKFSFRATDIGDDIVYMMEGGNKEALFGIFYTQEKIREIAGNL